MAVTHAVLLLLLLETVVVVISNNTKGLVHATGLLGLHVCMLEQCLAEVDAALLLATAADGHGGGENVCLCMGLF